MADTLTLVDAPGFFGEVSTNGNAWATDERPKTFRQKILQLNPNGDAVLTAITSMMNNEKTTDPEFAWWEKQLPLQGGTANFYTTEDGTSATSSPAVGTVVYAKVSSTVAAHFRVGQAAASRTGYNASKSILGKVVSVKINGSDSRIGLKLLEADSSDYLATADYIGVAGNINPEGSTIPDVIGYKPVKKSNYTQIFRNPYQLTRTAKSTNLRTGDPWQRLRQEQLMLHGLDIERALIWGQASENVGTNGEPERTTRGILNFIKDATYGAPENMISFRDSSDSEFTGQTWADKGMDFVDRYLEHLFQYGSTEKLCLCGTGFLRALNRLARAHGHVNVTSGQTTFGLQVTRWLTPFGSVYFKTHPLFARNESDRWMGLFMEPKNLVIRVMQDTTLKTDQGVDVAGTVGYDGQKEEYLAELGLELHHPKTFMVWSGVGLDNVN